ncbi:unnamed protein product [Adineta ricciae]|uniref:Uncharacterized protein n=1 Tax=Adineta ricciae TaxID=249248 RepID=A0A815N2Y4_ADIRI|nr:unnamed protein product [Adineta ricciae]
MHKYILENERFVFIEQILNELKTNVMLINWIQHLITDFQTKTTSSSWIIWNSLINVYFNSSTNIQIQLSSRKLIERFQQLVFVQFFVGKYRNEYLNITDDEISSFFIQNIEQFFNDDLFKSILFGLDLMTNIEFEIIRSILPILAELILKQKDVGFSYTFRVVGQIIRTLIIGSPKTAFEMKHLDKFQLSLFSSGLEKQNLFESNMTSDCHELLMSIYNNIDEGEQIISKIRSLSKERLVFLQKSIEKQAKDACAHLCETFSSNKSSSRFPTNWSTSSKSSLTFSLCRSCSNVICANTSTRCRLSTISLELKERLAFEDELEKIQNEHSQWTYLENISAANIQLKDKISQIYYSIVENILSNTQSILILHLLNFSYKSTDFRYLHEKQILPHVVLPLITCLNISKVNITHYIAFNWFRLYVLQLCEHFLNGDSSEMINEQQLLIFHQFIFNELKQISSNEMKSESNSFRKASICYFQSTTFDIALYRNQWLMFLLRCVKSYEYVEINVKERDIYLITFYRNG